MMPETLQAPAVLSEDEKIEFLRGAVGRMAEYTFPYIASILRVEDASTGTFCGSAFRILLSGQRAIVTAKHVIEEAASEGKTIAVSGARNEAPYEAPLDQWRRSLSEDLAVWYVPDAYAQGATAEPIAFWPAEAIDSSGARLGDDFLFVHGFPQVKAYFSPGLAAMQNTSFPYGAMRREEPMTRVRLTPDEFALHFEATGLLSSAGGEADFTWPPGLSGSAVWRLDIGGHSASSWAPEGARLVGMVLRWDQDEQVLLVLHARRVLAWLSSHGRGV